MFNMEKSFSVNQEEAGKRIDKVVTENIPGLSRSQCQNLINKGKVLVNGQNVKPSRAVKARDWVEIKIPAQSKGVKPQNIPLDIIYEDQDIIVVNKQAGMVVHPGPGHPDNTLVNGLLHHCQSLAKVGDPSRPGIVHRLDKGTSGVIVVAKTNQSYQKLVKQFKKRVVAKTYFAIVHGSFEEKEGLIDMPIGRDKIHRKQMTVTSKNGKPSVTEFVVKRETGGFSLLEITPETGRTHQIRVHLSQIGHPILGDSKYGKRSEKLAIKRFMLHASSIKFKHPTSQRKVEFKAPLPANFKLILDSLPR